MQWTQLNVFQKLTRQWDAICPYNAAQAMKLAGAPDRPRLQGLWRQTLCELGLGSVRFAGNAFRHEPLDDRWTKSDLQFTGPGSSLDAFVTAQLACPFDQRDSPLRPFIHVDPSGYWLGVVYHHWVADSASIRVLLREWFLRLHHPHRARRKPLSFPGAGYRSSFGPAVAGWNYFDAAMSTLRWGARMRRARRVETANYDQLATRFALHALPDGLPERLVRVARIHGGTLNDLFLSVVAQICDELVPVKRTRKRRDLALGTIVNLRAHGPNVLRDDFGLFLGFTSVICQSNDLHDWPRLVRAIAAQNALQKRRAAPQSSMLRMAAALLIHRVYSTRPALNWYRKRVPLAGGVSNVNLNRDWPGEFHPHPLLDYVRVSPCGPMMPIVFTPTTLGEQLNLGLTWRESLISPGVAQEIADAFTQRLIRLAEAG